MEKEEWILPRSGKRCFHPVGSFLQELEGAPVGRAFLTPDSTHDSWSTRSAVGLCTRCVSESRLQGWDGRRRAGLYQMATADRCHCTALHCTALCCRSQLRHAQLHGTLHEFEIERGSTTSPDPPPLAREWRAMLPSRRIVPARLAVDSEHNVFRVSDSGLGLGMAGAEPTSAKAAAER
jgi:hypothetical protein